MTTPLRNTGPLDPRLTQALVELFGQFDEPDLPRERVWCPLCDGKGMQPRLVLGTDQWREPLAATPEGCPLCRGKGWVPGKAP